MINQEKIQEWVRIYLKHIQDITVDVHVSREEGYKILAVANFQKYFNLEAPDLANMLEQAITNNNLVTGAQYWPRKMLLIYAQEYTEETRTALRNLCDESVDVYARITNAREEFEKINDKRIEKTGEQGHSYIGIRFLSLLLGYIFPDKYNALKPVEWKFFCRYINPEFAIPNKTLTGEQYRYYEPCIEALRQYIKDREDIKVIKDALVRGAGYSDDNYHWMTQNVIYVTARILAGERSDQQPEKVERTHEPEEEEILSENVVNTDEDNTGFMPLEKHLEEYIMNNWDTVDFGEKLTVYREDDGTPGQQYVTDVGIIDILAKDAKGDFVVIELKRAESKYHVLGQVLNYMQWVKDNLVTEKEKVRGMIVVGKADNTLKSALKQVADKVILKEYRIKMTLTNPQ
jgi:Endonuclease NucS